MVSWPDMIFGPTNLWTLPPAWWFYMKPNEKLEYSMNYMNDFKEKHTTQENNF